MLSQYAFIESERKRERKPTEKKKKKVFKRHTTWIYYPLTFFFFLTVQSGFHWIAKIKSLSGDPAV